MKDWRNMPGPGDPETWPPCTGHPMDPRTPPEPDFHEDPEYLDRMQDNDWFFESLTEATLESISALKNATEEQNTDLIGVIFLSMVEEYCKPDGY